MKEMKSAEDQPLGPITRPEAGEYASDILTSAYRIEETARVWHDRTGKKAVCDILDEIQQVIQRLVHLTCKISPPPAW